MEFKAEESKEIAAVVTALEELDDLQLALVGGGGVVVIIG